MAYDASGEERFTHGEGPGPGREARPATAPVHERNKSWYWLFLLPFFGVFFPWIYNTNDPEFIGIPFFYWYQMLWVPLTVVLTILVYIKTKGDRR
jgi:uncharacterized protein DUF3311